MVLWLSITLFLRKRPVKNPSIWKESLTWIVPWYALYAGGIWKGDILVADIEELETMNASEIYSKRLNAKEVVFPKWKFYFSSRRWTNQTFWRRSGSENTHLDTGKP